MRNNDSMIGKILRGVVLCLCTLGALTGCAGKTTVSNDPIFFPPEPNPPRIQFLLGIRDSRDVEAKDDGFSLFSVQNGNQKTQVRTLVKPYGVAVNGTTLYVSDTMQRTVAVINLEEGRFELLKGNFGPGSLKKPTGIAVDSEGQLFVADTQRRLVLAYDALGNFVRSYGDDLKMKPVDVAVDSRQVYILDSENHSIRVLDRQTGKQKSEFGNTGESDSRFRLPISMTLDDKGKFAVSNVLSGRILSYDRDGNYLGGFGKLGDGFGQFSRPRGVAAGKDGRLYVVDAAFQNVQMFNQDYRLLMFFGDPGQSKGSLNIPAGIAVSSTRLDYFQTLAAKNFELSELIVVANQEGPAKLSIYGLGHMRGVDYDAFYRQAEEERRKEQQRREKEESPSK